MKFYAVKAGRVPGIYETWAECKEQIYQYSGAVFKGFETKEEAAAFLDDDNREEINESLPYAYVDGSYKRDPARYGYGGYIVNGNQRHIIQGTGNSAAFLPDRNIAGEAVGALRILHEAIRLRIRELNLYFDYAGLEQWARGSWKAKTALSIYYRDMVDLLSDDIKVNFIHVKGHTGIEGNEIADYLAKEAVGAKLRKKDIAALEAFRQGAADPAAERSEGSITQ